MDILNGEQPMSEITIQILENAPELLTFGVSDKIDKMTTNYIVEKNKLIEDYIYKNLDTNVLKAMKLKIENELLERRLRSSNK